MNLKFEQLSEVTFEDVSGSSKMTVTKSCPSCKCEVMVLGRGFVPAVTVFYGSISLRMPSVGHLREPVLPIRRQQKLSLIAYFDVAFSLPSLSVSLPDVNNSRSISITHLSIGA